MNVECVFAAFVEKIYLSIMRRLLQLWLVELMHIEMLDSCHHVLQVNSKKNNVTWD